MENNTKAKGTPAHQHYGHRERLRNRFLENGFQGFSDHEMLELVLFYAIPRKDTNGIAHSLLDAFGSISKVFEADISDLKAIKGMSEYASTLLKMIPKLSQVYLSDRWGDRPLLNDHVRAGDYLKDLFVGYKNEVFYVLSLDAQCRLLYADRVHEGLVSETPVFPRAVVESALRHNAACVIVAHNHPGGTLSPSKSDVAITHRLYSVFKEMSVSLLDHIIVSGSQCVSLKNRNLLYPAEMKISEDVSEYR
ncbi:MAG: DNA repair protein RadC [Clostridiales bacterium]|nr:DNA repair protein RadC [Clostridiales bacterium]